MGLLGLVRTACRDAVEFLYPRQCLHCDAEAEGLFCTACAVEWDALRLKAACYGCGHSVADPELPCAWCHGKGRKHLHRVARLGKLDGPLRSAVLAQKYRGEWWVAEQLAEYLADSPPARSLLHDADVLVPVPLHPTRRFFRGFNQAEVVARVLARRFRKPVAFPVIRHRRTPPQVATLTPRQRWENVRDAFRLVDPMAVRARRVVVLDDVMTTGATIASVVRTLTPARPTQVSAVVLAVAESDRRRSRGSGTRIAVDAA